MTLRPLVLTLVFRAIVINSANLNANAGTFIFRKAGVVRSLVSRFPKDSPTTALFSMRNSTFGEDPGCLSSEFHRLFKASIHTRLSFSEMTTVHLNECGAVQHGRKETL